MIVKSIAVRVRPGHYDAYLESQRIWNAESRTAQGYLGAFCGRDPRDPDLVRLLAYWRSRADYEAWMAAEHDRIAVLAGAHEHIEHLEIAVLDEALEPESAVPCTLLAEETLEAADVQLYSEAYRCSAALRTAVQLALFDYLGDEPVPGAELADRLGVDAGVLERLLTVLRAMDLADERDGGWALSPLAARTLRTGATAYQGHMVLHNTRPALVRRWWALGDELGVDGLGAGAGADPDAAQEMFVRAMSDTARAGQADALCDAIDLHAVGHLLDVGGAAADCCVALCLAFPQLIATVLDLPATEPLARAAIEAAGLDSRISFVGGDYREGPLPGPVDAVLFSNILRGETSQGIDVLLAQAKAALTPRGRVVIHDLFPQQPPGHPGLRAALFGLHLPHAANPTVAVMAAKLERAGFAVDSVQRLRRSIVANAVIVARRP